MAARTGAVREHAHLGSLLLAIHDFVARSTDELSLAKGDRIELIERDDDFGDGWFLGRHMTTGKTGLFPEVYTTPAPRGTLANLPNSRRRSDGPPRTPQEGSNPPTMTGPLQAMSESSQRPASASSMQPNAASPLALRTSAPVTTPIMKPAVPTVDSPVMNETLSVIDEHMNDMGAPRSPFPNGSNNTLASSTGSTPLQLARFSYIAGQETDEEEQDLHTEDEVMAWSPDRVAEYLEDHGVERVHCEIFKEQEISGEVLLAMEQSSIFLKEFDLGPVGRRLKTWHKVRQLQDECRNSAPPRVPRSASEYSNVGDDASSDAPRNRSSTMGSILPRALDTSRQSVAPPQRSATLQSLSTAAASIAASRGGPMSPLQSMTSISRQDTTSRPSAQIIREMQHSRRHSSMDSSNGDRLSHRKQPSLDQQWQLGQPQVNGGAAPTSHSHTLSADTASRRHSGLVTTSPDDLDRGYFSSNELDQRASRKNVLTKRNSSAVSPVHSRQSSSTTQRNRTSLSTRISSPMGPVSPITDQSIFGPLNSVGERYGSVRSVTAPPSQFKPSVAAQQDLHPVVTKLDYSNTSESSLGQALRNDSTQKSSSPISNKMAFFTTKPKMIGLRTISDAITRSEKTSASPTKEGIPFSSRTGSTTPSTETQSIDMQKSEVQSRTSGGSFTGLVPPAVRQKRMKPKTKKSTSAYTRGLQKIPPSDQMLSCDYSGWMRKKSGSLMTTWKPRLFVLKGRRLSYYYSDTDTEEKGLIDISFHRVLPAHNETLTGLHATVTGATTNTATSPRESTTPTLAQRDLALNPPPAGDESIFIFKLVPPKTGLAKGVAFTRPTVHYFAVNSRQEGRLWMAALMKATIDRDEDGMVTTTYNQKTISLAKARARRERPPALREEDDGVQEETLAELDGSDDPNGSGAGLGIEGVSEKEVVGGAQEEVGREDASLLTMSTAATGAGDGSREELNEKVGETGP